MSVLGWSSDASSLKRSMAEALRIAIVAAKSLSIISFLTFLVRADGSPSLLLRLSGYRLSSSSSFPTNSVPYRASQLYLEQRKFMWLAMIVSRIFCTNFAVEMAMNYFFLIC